MSTIPTLDALRGVTQVHNAMRVVIRELDRGLAISVISLDAHAIYIAAPSILHANRWRSTFPTGRVEVGGLMVPLHIAVTGDVEGGVL